MISLANKIKLFPIAAQASLLEKTYPGSSVKTVMDRELIWQHTIQPSPLSDQYKVLLHYSVGNSPELYVVKPSPLSLAKSATKLPHVYDQKTQRLCLYYPDGKQWNKSKPLARTVVFWAYEWLYHYEIWLGTDDDWKGGGVHPFSKKQKFNIV